MKPKLIRITTIPLSLEKLLEGQLHFMSEFYEVTAISSEKERLEEFGIREEVNTYYIPLTRKITPIQDLVGVIRLVKFLKKNKPDIVHTHTPKAGLIGMVSACITRVPNRLHTVAGLPLMEATGIKRIVLEFVEKVVYKCATNVYPNSEGLYNFIVKSKFVKKNKLKIIGKGSSNGIDTKHFDPSLFLNEDNKDLRLELGIDENDFVYVFVGRLVGDKGINELVEAFCEVQKQCPSSSLLLVGDFETELDPLSNNTIRIIESHSKIFSVGFKKDVRPFLFISNALTFPSYREGFPNVVMQAGAMGLPSIVSNINGCNEIITHNENGLIVERKNVADLVEAMALLASDKTVVDKLCLIARDRIVNLYNRQFIWKEILKEYKSLNTN